MRIRHFTVLAALVIALTTVAVALSPADVFAQNTQGRGRGQANGPAIQSSGQNNQNNGRGATRTTATTATTVRTATPRAMTTMTATVLEAAPGRLVLPGRLVPPA
jgi:hypothetical protein